MELLEASIKENIIVAVGSNRELRDLLRKLDGHWYRQNACVCSFSPHFVHKLISLLLFDKS